MTDATSFVQAQKIVQQAPNISPSFTNTNAIGLDADGVRQVFRVELANWLGPDLIAEVKEVVKAARAGAKSLERGY